MSSAPETSSAAGHGPPATVLLTEHMRMLSLFTRLRPAEAMRLWSELKELNRVRVEDAGAFRLRYNPMICTWSDLLRQFTDQLTARRRPATWKQF